jgi:hypothetical protein
VTQTTEAAIPDASDLQLRQMTSAGLFDPDMDFRKLLAEAGPKAFWSQGFRLVDKEWLLGVPHLIISGTYREGFPRGGAKADYISVEAVIADREILSSPAVMSHIMKLQPDVHGYDDLKVFANEAVVYNDGSTGIRRTMTGYFTQAGIIDPGKPKDPDENVLDRQYQRWASGAEQATERIVAHKTGEPFRVIARRGLRKSEYANEYGDAVTYYIA